MDLGDTQMRGTVFVRARGEGDNGSDGEDEDARPERESGWK